jgi:hypothetical protein
MDHPHSIPIGSDCISARDKGRVHELLAVVGLEKKSSGNAAGKIYQIPSVSTSRECLNAYPDCYFSHRILQYRKEQHKITLSTSLWRRDSIDHNSKCTMNSCYLASVYLSKNTLTCSQLSELVREEHTYLYRNRPRKLLRRAHQVDINCVIDYFQEIIRCRKRVSSTPPS